MGLLENYKMRKIKKIIAKHEAEREKAQKRIGQHLDELRDILKYVEIEFPLLRIKKEWIDSKKPLFSL